MDQNGGELKKIDRSNKGTKFRAEGEASASSRARWAGGGCYRPTRAARRAESSIDALDWVGDPGPLHLAPPGRPGRVGRLRRIPSARAPTRAAAVPAPFFECERSQRVNIHDSARSTKPAASAPVRAGSALSRRCRRGGALLQIRPGHRRPFRTVKWRNHVRIRKRKLRTGPLVGCGVRVSGRRK